MREREKEKKKKTSKVNYLIPKIRKCAQGNKE